VTGWNVSLAKVNPVRLYRHRDVYAVVDDDLNPGSSRYFHGFESSIVKGARRCRFLAKLNQRRASGSKALDLLGVRQPREALVGDWI
jgi:hypothetical protein